jgi:hypothetical protein
MFFGYIQIRGAVVEGASYGSRNPTNAGAIVSEVTAHGVPAGTAVSVNVASGCLTSNGVGTITVSAASTFTPITTNFLESYWGIGSVNLAASSTMRCLT